MKKVLILLLCAALLLSGCGAGKSSYAANEKAYPAETAAAYDTGSYDAASGDSGSGAELPQGRKFIITMNVDAETDDLDSALNRLNTALAEVSGYIQDQNIYNGSAYYSGRRYRSASLTVRIPAERVDEFTEEMSGIANVVSTNLSREDITLSYVATESRVKALQTEEARLLELMEQAQTMSDLLEIEERLTEVRYELENYTSTLRLYDNQVDYATLDLTLREVAKFTPPEKQGFWEKVTSGLADSIVDLGQGLVDVTAWVLIELPYLVLVGLLGWLVVLLTRRSIKKRRAKKAQKTQEEQNK